MLARLRLPFLVAFAIAATPLAAVASGQLHAIANAISDTQIEIRWNWDEHDPEYPVLQVQWVGYDLYRRDPAACSPWVRLNAEIIPRVPGVDHGGVWVDAPPTPTTTWEYELRPVTAVRQQTMQLGSDCWMCPAKAWESAPKYAGPVTVGTLSSFYGIAVYVAPHACWYQGMYFDGEDAERLRPYVDSGQAFRFYGDEGWWDPIDGIGISLERFEPVTTPTVRSSWGQVKTIYR